MERFKSRSRLKRDLLKKIPMKKDKPEMKADDVIEFVKLLNESGINIIADGGWEVDALLEKQ